MGVQSAPEPRPDPVPPPAPPPVATPQHHQAGSGGGGFVSSLGNFTSALFGSLPAASDPSEPSGPFGSALRPVGSAPALVQRGPELADDSFQPVSLEPVTGPTPTFYNPASLPVGHGGPPGLGPGQASVPQLQPGTSSPIAPIAPSPPQQHAQLSAPGGEPVVAKLFALNFEPQPSDFHFTQTRPATATTPLTSAPSFESTSSSPPFATPTGPPPVPAFGPPPSSASPLGSAPASQRLSAAPSPGPSPGPPLGLPLGPPPGTRRRTPSPWAHVCCILYCGVLICRWCSEQQRVSPRRPTTSLCAGTRSRNLLQLICLRSTCSSRVLSRRWSRWPCWSTRPDLANLHLHSLAVSTRSHGPHRTPYT